jgi:hypothetical protein
MRTAVVVVLFVLGILTPLDCQVGADKPKRSDWQYMAPITINSSADERLAEFAITPSVHAIARVNLTDLRIVTGNGTEVGYVIRKGEGTTENIPLQAKLYNRSFLPGKQSSVTADFGGKTLKNRIKIETSGTNFRRKVRIEGSDSGETWGMVLEGGFLFRVQGAAGERDGFDKSLVEFPSNDQRYLRITVFPGSDDPKVIEIQGIQASRQVVSTPETAEVPVVSAIIEEKERFSEISLDLGSVNIPLHEISLEFLDSDFFRHVAMEGRNQERRTIKPKVKDANVGERTVPEPWTRIGTGTVFRFSGCQGKEESLKLPLKAYFRYIRIRINNFDDPPLRFRGARVNRLIDSVSFPFKKHEKYLLYVGNPNATSPVYDLTHYIKPMREQGIARADLGSLTSTTIREEKDLPWSEKHQGIIWVALLVMVASLGLIVYRVARGTRIKSQSQDPTA